MVYTKNLILVCTGRDTTKAASLGMPVLQLCLGISQSGALQRLKVSAVQRHCLLGVTAPPQAINFCSAERSPPLRGPFPPRRNHRAQA